MKTAPMKTVYAEANPESIRQGADILRRGGLVAVPTETVYGLGADAQNEEAVAKVYKAKGRPSDNPLIWHGNSLEQFEEIVNFTEAAGKLAEAFWPGPLTMVLPRKQDGSSLALRVPSNPVIRDLIAASGCLIAAPSANLSGRPSPTTAKHVAQDLDGIIDMIIDGGPAQNGLESTVVDLYSAGTPKLLRPGSITLEMLKEVLGEVECFNPDIAADSAPLAPGMKYRHYAPKAPLILVIGSREDFYAEAESYKGAKVGFLETSGIPLEKVAQTLFRRLREFDDQEVSVIIAEGVKEEGLGAAIMNRLRKAARKVVGEGK